MLWKDAVGKQAQRRPSPIIPTLVRLKGPTYEAGTRLQAASGMHHLIGNLWHVLSEALDKNFEKPLRQHLENYRTVVNERSASYERALKEKSHIIRDTELRSMNRKERNLQSFREALSVLQRQVDDLDELKVSHYHEIIEHEEEVWNVVQSKVCVAVRSTMDVFDKFTAKAYVATDYTLMSFSHFSVPSVQIRSLNLCCSPFQTPLIPTDHHKQKTKYLAFLLPCRS